MSDHQFTMTRRGALVAAASAATALTFSAAPAAANECFNDCKGVCRVVVHVMTFRNLGRAALSAAVMGDDPVALRYEEQHLGVPIVGRKWPPMVEHDGLGGTAC